MCSVDLDLRKILQKIRVLPYVIARDPVATARDCLKNDPRSARHVEYSCYLRAPARNTTVAFGGVRPEVLRGTQWDSPFGGYFPPF